MIVSASRRTDIPCYYSEWLMNRLKAKYALYRNPMNRTQIIFYLCRLSFTETSFLNCSIMRSRKLVFILVINQSSLSIRAKIV